MNRFPIYRNRKSALDDLIAEIEEYTPWNQEEAGAKAQMLRFMKVNPDCLLRANTIAHMTASAWVVNPHRTKVVMAYHRIYDSWAWLGGHADGQADLLRVALEETEEECGLSQEYLKPIEERIFSLETLTVDGHFKQGEWVAPHLHFNLTYLIEAEEGRPFCHKEDENSGVRWFFLEEAIKASAEPWIVEHVYGKLMEKMKG